MCEIIFAHHDSVLDGLKPTSYSSGSYGMIHMKNAILVTLLSLVALSAHAEFVSADAASDAVVRGARVVDVRNASAYSAGHLPGAVRVDATAAMTDRASLQAMVSSQGVDLSREVVVVGEAGDVLAQQLQAHLKAYATGRVNWLVGGVTEWTLSGRALTTDAVALPAVPQFLVPLHAQGAVPRMAGAALRDTAQFSPAVTEKVAAAQRN